MQLQNKIRLSLFSDFFNLEIDYKNDYVEYITTTNHTSDTSLLNNTKKTINKKIQSTCKYAETKKLSNLFLTIDFLKENSKEQHKQFIKLFNNTSYKKIDVNSKCYIRFINKHTTYCNLFVPSEHIYALIKSIKKIFTSPQIVLRNHVMACQV